MAEQMVSLNDVVNLVKELSSRGSLKGLGGWGGPLADCENRCGCVGTDCGCHGRVFGVWDRLSWVEFKAMRENKIEELKRQLDVLEAEGMPKQAR
jgi:hypothetical protein